MKENPETTTAQTEHKIVRILGYKFGRELPNQTLSDKGILPNDIVEIRVINSDPELDIAKVENPADRLRRLYLEAKAKKQ